MDIFTYAFVQNALLGVIIVSIASAIIGTYIVTRRMVFITGGITHACFGGLGLGYFLGMSPILMASVFAISSALGVEWLSTRQRVREDSAIAVVWALGMAIGTLFIFLSPGYVPELTSFLFGNILTITRSDIYLFAAFTIILILFFIIQYRRIIACAFDRDFARTIGLHERFINYAMTIFIAVGIVLTIRLIGIMLLMSLMTLPQMIAEIFTNRFKSMMITSVIVSLICAIGGLLCAYLIDVPASATIVILLIVIYAIARTVKNIMRKRNFKQKFCNNTAI
ncbi:MAG: metal ABC transporter permease [Muribaculaceae bacterium]